MIGARGLIYLAYLFVITSIVLTRVVKAFTAAEFFAVSAFVCGILLLRFAGRWGSLSHSRRAIVVGSLVGLSGLLIKGVLVLLGIGAGDHAAHDGTHPLLVHIHHLFFNLGFLLFGYAALAAAVNWWRTKQ